MKTLDIRDLRIGDYVTTNERSTRAKKGEYYRITAINSNINLNNELVGTATIEPVNDKYFGYVGAWIECLEPIPITEELMLKIGFLISTKIDKLLDNHNCFCANCSSICS